MKEKEDRERRKEEEKEREKEIERRKRESARWSKCRCCSEGSFDGRTCTAA